MKRKSHIVAAILIFVWCILQGATALSETDQKISENPRQLVERFLKLDANGARLDSDAYKAAGLGEFIVSSGYESPGWDEAVLIRKYEIQKVTQSDQRASITVIYDTIGSVSDDVYLKDKKQTYSFQLMKQNIRWVIIGPYDLPQHISVSTAVRHFEILDKLQSDVDPNTRILLNKLKKLKAELNKSVHTDAE